MSCGLKSRVHVLNIIELMITVLIVCCRVVLRENIPDTSLDDPSRRTLVGVSFHELPLFVRNGDVSYFRILV